MHVQVQHEVKRKERDADKLRSRLRELMNERSRDARVALEAVGRFQDSARGRAKKSDEAMYQVCNRVCSQGISGGLNLLSWKRIPLQCVLIQVCAAGHCLDV